MRVCLLATALLGLALAPAAAAQSTESGETLDAALGPGGRVLTVASTPTAVYADGRRIASQTPARAVLWANRAPRAFFLSDGSAVVAWIDERTVRMPTLPEGDDGCCTYLRMAWRPAGAARFGRPRSYPEDGGRLMGLGRVATGPGGRFALQAGEGVIAGRRGSLRHGLKPVVPPVDIAFDRRGRLIVTHGDVFNLRTSIARRTRSAPPLPSGPDQPGRIETEVATAPNGAQVALSKRRIGRRLHIELARRTPNGAFGRPRTVTVLRWPDFPPAGIDVGMYGGRPVALVTAEHRLRIFTPQLAVDRRLRGTIAEAHVVGRMLVVVEAARRRWAVRVACRPSAPLRTVARARTRLTLGAMQRDALVWRRDPKPRVARTGC